MWLTGSRYLFSGQVFPNFVAWAKKHTHIDINDRCGLTGPACASKGSACATPGWWAWGRVGAWACGAGVPVGVTPPPRRRSPDNVKVDYPPPLENETFLSGGLPAPPWACS